jgi:signal transduction histidine kinase
MSESQSADAADGRGRKLWEQQLLLMHAADQLILDQTNTLAETLQFIVDQTQTILNAEYVDILFAYDDGLRVEISSDPQEIGRFIPIERSISGLVLSRGEPVLVGDVQSDPLLRERYFPRAEREPHGSAPRLSVLAHGLSLDGQRIGVINVEAPLGRFGESHRDFASAVARQISMAITHAALFDEDNLLTATDRLLVEGSGAGNDVIMREVFDRVLIALNSLAFVRPDAAEILLAEPQEGWSLVVAYSTNSTDIGIRVDINSSVLGEAFRTGRTVLLQRADERPDFRPIMSEMRCQMAIPIIVGGRNPFPIGVLNLESSRENAFSVVGQVLAERFARRLVNVVSMTKIRADIDAGLQDQLMVIAGDQVLNAVHRINNNIGSIRAIVLDLLEDLQSPGPPELDDLALRLRMIESNADRALAIPGDLLKRIAAPHESLNVNAQVEAGIAAVRIPRHIELVLDLASGLPNIPCTALDLVVENLLLNSVKAMHDRPGPLQVTTLLDERLPREPFIVVSVEDTGIGMSRDEIGRLFEPRKAGHRGGGLGFGMMWVRSWVRRAQGLIDVQSTPGEGTTVNIRFQIDPQLIDRTPPGGGSR